MRKQSNKKPVWSRQDNAGNKIYVTSNNRIYVYNAQEKRDRLIGTISPQTKTISVRRKPHHLHFKTNSYGFNEIMISTAHICDTIKLSCPYGTYKIPIQKIIDNGFYLHFKSQGFEKQIFVSIENISQYKIK